MLHLYKTGIIAGRFQHIHKVHEFMINNGLTLCEKLVVFIAEPEKSRTLRDPFTFEERKELIEKVYYNVDSKDLEIYPIERQTGPLNNWMYFAINKTIEVASEYPTLIIEGRDKRSMDFFYEGDMEFVSELVISEKILEDTNILDIRGTNVRNYLKLDEYANWSECVNPLIWDQYDRLKEIVKSLKN